MVLALRFEKPPSRRVSVNPPPESQTRSASLVTQVGGGEGEVVSPEEQ